MSTLAVISIAIALEIAGQKKGATDPAPRASAVIHRGGEDALAQARRAEGTGEIREAVRLYRESVAAGNGEAARRLGDIYWRGAGPVERDLAESLRWYRVAETRGERLAQAVRLR